MEKKMKYIKAVLTQILCNYFEDDFKRIEHAMEVLNYAEHIALKIGDYDKEILIAAALLHDIGIKPAEKIHGMNNGKLQEELGPPEARKILESLSFDSQKTKIVCEIIGNHHSPSNYDYPELKILKEADRIVNQFHEEL